MNEQSIRLTEDLMLLQRQYNYLVRRYKDELEQKENQIRYLQALLDEATASESLRTVSKRKGKNQ